MLQSISSHLTKSLPQKGNKVNLPKQLPPEFYTRDTLTLARDLLGKRMVRRFEGQRLAGYITEVEAYIGEEDEACHANSGKTERTAPMYGPPGHLYVYLIYGMYHCLNIVTEREGFPAAILVRALRPVEGQATIRRLRGPSTPNAISPEAWPALRGAGRGSQLQSRMPLRRGCAPLAGAGARRARRRDRAQSSHQRARRRARPHRPLALLSSR